MATTADTDEYNPREIFGDASRTTDLDSSIWLKDLRDKIFSMFKSPLREDYNEEVFRWISTLCTCKSRFSWLCSDESNWTKEEAKIFSLIARLSINELHILLPNIRRHLICGDEVECDDDGKVLARPANANEYSNFGVHLVIFEETIHSLVHGQDDDDDGRRQKSSRLNRLADSIESNELKSLLERLKEIASELLDYLEDVHRHWEKISAETSDQTYQASQGALRAVSVWVSEDAGSFEPQCKRFLIDLIVKNLIASEQLTYQETSTDLLIMALHSVCSGDDEMKKVLKGVPESKVALQKYLDLVQQEYGERKKDKVFKLKCGLIKDLL